MWALVGTFLAVSGAVEVVERSFVGKRNCLGAILSRRILRAQTLFQLTCQQPWQRGWRREITLHYRGWSRTLGLKERLMPPAVEEEREDEKREKTGKDHLLSAAGPLKRG